MIGWPTSLCFQGQTARIGSAVALMLLVGVLLLIVFICGAFIMIRTSRRRRAMMEHKPAPPTESDDVWAKHELPEDWDDDESDRKDLPE